MNFLNLNLSKDGEFLTEVIRHRDHLRVTKLKQLYIELGDDYAFDICHHNKIVSIAADSLSKCGVELPQRWDIEFKKVSSQVTQYMDELDKAADLLLDANIPLIALKNSGIARSLYKHPGASPMGDIDVLVRKSDFRKAHEILTSKGYILKFRSPLEEENLELAEQGGGAEYSVKMESGEHLWFELQWRPVAGRWIRPDQEPKADSLVARSITIEDSSARLLHPLDNLLQVCLHTAKHSYVRAPGFRLHTDVDRIVRSQQIEWDIFLNMVIKSELRTSVFFSLAFAHDLMGTPIPKCVLESLAPPPWKLSLMTRWLENVGLFDPDGKKWSRLGYIVFVSLLYDNLSGFIRGVIPSRQSMIEKYGNVSLINLPFFYVRRIYDLIFRRTLVK